jgi:predicted PhzF superfamily epimerase YddE/YHI9
MPIPIFHVDAFTFRAVARLFSGNPAAVCPLEAWLDDGLLRSVAAENNLSETAFFVPNGDHYDLRWFTPRCEVKLCGHATLASAFVILQILAPEGNFKRNEVHFETRFSGGLTVSREGEMLAMDFPALAPWECLDPPAALLEGLGQPPSSVVQIEDDYFAVYANEEDVRRIRPDFKVLEKLHPAGAGITAPGNSCDFVSRFFVPSYGIPEDPVTGSTHCSLAPYWAKRLGKTTLFARQISERGGEIWCEVRGERVIIKGNAVLTLRGELLI